MPDLGRNGDSWVEIFYADPVDEDGNVIGVVEFTASASWTDDVTVTKIPYDEMAMPEDAPVFRVPDKDEES